MVDIDAVGLEDFFELIDECLSGCLDAQHIVDFVDVVGVGPPAVDLVVAETGPQVGAGCLEDYLLVVLLLEFGEVFLGLRLEDRLLGCFDGFKSLDA